MSDLVRIDARRLRDLARLRGAERDFERGIKRVHRELGPDLAGEARSRARGLGGVHAWAARSITATSRPQGVAVGVDGADGAAVGVWGALARTGWNAPNVDSPPQHPTWVGRSWDVGGAGGPYGINEAIRTEERSILARFDDLVDVVLGHGGL